MANLVSEYIDIKNVKHTVAHSTRPIEDDVDRDQIVDEILMTLINKRRAVRV